MKKANELFQIDAIVKESKKLMADETVGEIDEDNYKHIYVTDIADSHLGIYQLYKMANFIDVLESCTLEEGVTGKYVVPDDSDFIEYRYEEIAEELNTMNLLPGQFYFGWLEGDGSFGLFYMEEIKD